MDKVFCPNCGSSCIAVERRPDGDHLCAKCGHKWKQPSNEIQDLRHALKCESKKREFLEELRNVLERCVRDYAKNYKDYPIASHAAIALEEIEVIKKRYYP